ncbi:unnamed protein product [Symbiodinium necroappetens]|uniref:Uncharacterized protein n=1 Tax=Symbiodinium necroappetens TaxID=1628268 RepID=A0A812L044_9DINO|nr:unnamed protein product [Symbiodinium necroappetens]
MASVDREVSGTDVSFEPAKKGDPVSVSSKQESTLWKSMMERYHGTGWRDALDEQEAEVAEAERELGEKNDEEELLAEKPEAATKGLGADPSGSPSRELVERLRSLQGAGTVSGATSLASGGGAVVDQLRRKLAEPYDPSMESLGRYQNRVTRVAEALEMSGEFVDATEIAVLLMRAEIQDSLKGLGRDEQLQQLKLRFAQQLVDGADGEEEREVRLSTLLTMVEERGGKLSGKKEKLFSGSDLSPAKLRKFRSRKPSEGWKWRLQRLSRNPLRGRDLEQFPC